MKISLRSILAAPRGVGLGILFVLQYLLLVLTFGMCFIVFSVLNRTRVIGKRHARLKPGTVIVSNHQSMLDSFLVGFVVGAPQLLWKPWLMPWHLADGKNFFSHPLLRHVYLLLKAIPVASDANGVRRDFNAFRTACRVLRTGTLHVFIEGTRSSTYELMPAKASAAGIVLLAKATVKPVYFTGMHDFQPYRRSPGDGPRTFLRIFGRRVEWLLHFRLGQRITVNIGPDLSPQQIARLAGEGKLHERSERLATELMGYLYELQSVTHTLRSAS